MSVKIHSFPQGPGNVYVVITDDEGNKEAKKLMNASEIVLEVTNDTVPFRSGQVRAPLAMGLGDYTGSVKATVGDFIDDDLLNSVLGFTKCAVNEALYLEREVEVVLEDTVVDVASELETGEAIIDDTVDVVFVDSNIQLARDFTGQPAEDEFYFDGRTEFHFNQANVNAGREVLISFITSKAGADMRHNSKFKGKCMELYLTFPILNTDCTLDKDRVRVIHVFKAFLIPNIAYNLATGSEYKFTFEWQMLANSAGYTFRQSILESPDKIGH